MIAGNLQTLSRHDEQTASALKALLAILRYKGIITKEQEQAILKEAGFSKECQEVYH